MWNLFRLGFIGKLFFFSLVWIIPPMIIASIYFQYQLSNTFKETSGKVGRDILINTQRHIDREHHELSRIIKVISSNPKLILSISENDRDYIEEYLSQVAVMNPRFNYLAILDQSGEILVLTTQEKSFSRSDIAEFNVRSVFNTLDKTLPELQFNSPDVDPLLGSLNLSDSLSRQYYLPIFDQNKVIAWIALSYQWQKSMNDFQEVLLEELLKQKIPAIAIGITDVHYHLLAGVLKPEKDGVVRIQNQINVGGQTLLSNLQMDEHRYALSTTFQKSTLFILLLVFYLILLVGIFCVFRLKLFSPLRKLEEAASRWSEGDLDYRLPETGNDTWRSMAASFNQRIEKEYDMQKRHDHHTRELMETNEQLKLSVKEALQASVAKSEFLASMSHEIRTPMNGVLGMLDLLIRSKLTNKQEHYASLAESSAKSLLGIINDILDFSKIEAGKMELDILDFDLRDHMGQITESMALKAQEKGVEVILDVRHMPISMVRGDPSRLRQVITNLLGNSIKFTEKGEILVRAELNLNSNKEEKGDLVFRCSVKDTGIGIPEDKLNLLFHSFSQVDASTTRKYGGTGLGLSIANQLCQLMGGEGIQVTSELGEGSEFSIEIPLGKSSREAVELPVVDIAGTNILIVDDNSTNREVLKGQLEIWGAHVYESDSAYHALDILDNEPIGSVDLAILDMQMPGMDGVALSKKITSSPKYRNIKLIMMTSIGERGDARYFASLGFSAYFAKPATFEDLHDAIKIVIEGGAALENASPLLTRHYLREIRLNDNNDKKTSSARVLLVEDNLINQEVAQGILNDLGYGVETVSNGQEAIRALAKAQQDEPYDIILMDCQMPIMDGYETTRSIRSGKSDVYNLKVPIIALTANAMKGDREKCIECGMDDYLSKPIEAVELERKLRFWLKGKATPCRTELNDDPPVLEAVGSEGTNAAVPLWDKDAALKRVRGKMDRLIYLLELFIGHSPQHFDALNIAVKSGRLDTIEYESHSIKASCGNLGAEQLQSLSNDMELLARKGEIEKIQTSWDEYEKQYRSLLEAFRAVVAETKPQIRKIDEDNANSVN